MLQYRYVIDKLLDVPPEAFQPPPKVDSAIVRMIPYAPHELPAVDERVLGEVVHGGVLAAPQDDAQHAGRVSRFGGGCTLIVALMAPGWIGLLQIGDGDAVIVAADARYDPRSRRRSARRRERRLALPSQRRRRRASGCSRDPDARAGGPDQRRLRQLVRQSGVAHRVRARAARGGAQRRSRRGRAEAPGVVGRFGPGRRRRRHDGAGPARRRRPSGCPGRRTGCPTAPAAPDRSIAMAAWPRQCSASSAAGSSALNRADSSSPPVTTTVTEAPPVETTSTTRSHPARCRCCSPGG